MAKDIIMKKGNEEITISEDFLEHYKKLGFTNLQIFIRYFFQFLFMFLSVTFMYSMCKRCRGLEGFLILMLLSFVTGLIAMGPFISTLKKDLASKEKVVK